MENDSPILPSEPGTLRKRGAQPGNTNSLKHGFYSRRFRKIELEDLATALSPGLLDEIAMLRVVMRRVFDHATDTQRDLEDWSNALDILGMASTRLARLLRTQKDLGPAGAVTNVISQTITRIMKEKRF
jgi:hypothetical protein